MRPRSRRNAVDVSEDGTLRVYVTAPPEGGKANEAAVALLADRLGVAKDRVRIVRGQRARTKVLFIEGLDVQAVMSRLGRER